MDQSTIDSSFAYQYKLLMRKKIQEDPRLIQAFTLIKKTVLHHLDEAAASQEGQLDDTKYHLQSSLSCDMNQINRTIWGYKKNQESRIFGDRKDLILQGEDLQMSFPPQPKNVKQPHLKQQVDSSKLHKDKKQGREREDYRGSSFEKEQNEVALFLDRYHTINEIDDLLQKFRYFVENQDNIYYGIYMNYLSSKNRYYFKYLVPALGDIDKRMLYHLEEIMRVLKKSIDIERLTEDQLQKKKVRIDKARCDEGKKTLVLGIEEVLVHYEMTSFADYDKVVYKQKQPETKIYISQRPYLSSFLESVSKEFKLIAFSCGDRKVADPVIDYLDPKGDYFRIRLYKQDLIKLQGATCETKDIRILERDMKSIVLVDYRPEYFISHVENVIPILPYCQSREDEQLPALERFLNQLIEHQDVRMHILTSFRMPKYHYYKDVKELIKYLLSKE